MRGVFLGVAAVALSCAGCGITINSEEPTPRVPDPAKPLSHQALFWKHPEYTGNKRITQFYLDQLECMKCAYKEVDSNPYDAPRYGAGPSDPLSNLSRSYALRDYPPSPGDQHLEAMREQRIQNCLRKKGWVFVP